MRHLVSRTALAVAAISVAAYAQAFTADQTLDGLVEQAEISVTLDNFVRAATDIELDKYVSLAGGVNRFYHFRAPVPVDNQPTIRMN